MELKWPKTIFVVVAQLPSGEWVQEVSTDMETAETKLKEIYSGIELRGLRIRVYM